MWLAFLLPHSTLSTEQPTPDTNKRSGDPMHGDSIPSGFDYGKKKGGEADV